jgi:hypothetical protein
MRITSAGNVGIGTANPQTLTHLYRNSPYASRNSNPLVSVSGAPQLTLETIRTLGGTARLYCGIYDTAGSTAATIQSSAFITGTDSGRDLLLNPIGGFVGIGTDAPASRLHMHNSSASDNVLRIISNYTNDGPHPLQAFSRILFGGISPGTFGAGIQMSVPANSTINRSDLQFTTSDLGGAQVIRMTILGSDGTVDGRVGIGVTVPSYQLELSLNSAAKPTGGTWTSSSDMRIKKNIEDANLMICYNNLKELKLRRFEWDPEVYDDAVTRDRHALGFIAQEVISLFPKAVDIIPIKIIKDISYNNFHTLNVDQINNTHIGTTKRLIEIVEEQGAQITSLQTDLESKTTQITSLQTDLESKTTQITSLQTDLESKTTQITSLQTVLESKTTQITTLQSEIATIKAHLGI